MKSPFLILSAGALALALVVGTGRSVVARTELPSDAKLGKEMNIRALQRSARALLETPVRDPFSSENPAPAPLSESVPDQSAAQVRPSAPTFPDFRILGKQLDDEGWAVYIGEPGKSGQVWVVRQGESFHERYVVSRLAPPVLVIKHLRARQSRTFDIGKDEDIE